MNLFLQLCLALILVSARAIAQDADERLLSDAENGRVIIRDDTLYRFFVSGDDISVKPDVKKYYYWFKKDTILSTMGGYGGRLLNGDYKVYFPNKSLKESGQFRLGLKEGDWKVWDPKGELLQIVHWKRGEVKDIQQTSPSRKKRRHSAE